MDIKDIKKPEILNTHQTAEAMGISYPTLHRMIKSGKIKGVNMAKSGSKPIWGFTVEIIQAYYDRLQDSIDRACNSPDESQGGKS